MTRLSLGGLYVFDSKRIKHMQDRTAMPQAAVESPGTGPQFAATLVPSRFLPPKGFLALLLNIAALSYLSVYVFFFLGD